MYVFFIYYLCLLMNAIVMILFQFCLHNAIRYRVNYAKFQIFNLKEFRPKSLFADGRV